MASVYRQGGVHCNNCGHHWRAVVEMDEAVPLIAGLECPSCHEMTGAWDVAPLPFEPVDDEDPMDTLFREKVDALRECDRLRLENSALKIHLEARGKRVVQLARRIRRLRGVTT